MKLGALASSELKAEGERLIAQAKAELAEKTRQAKAQRAVEQQQEQQERARVAAAAAAEQQHQCGLADESMQPGTRVRIPPHGEGSYERWESSRLGANKHFVRFDNGGETKKVALKKLKPDDWQVLPFDAAEGKTGVDAGTML